jgi:ATP-binding cassette subfamily B protein/subfamily B ATP-binding cassette protein MsbA
MTKSTEQSSEGTWRVTVRMLRRFLSGETRGLAFGLALILVATAAGLLQPWPLKIAIDSVAGGAAPPAIVQRLYAPLAGMMPGEPRLGLLTAVCLALLLIELLLGAARVASTYVLNAVALRLVFRVRCTLFDHIQRQSLAFHDASKVGDSLYRITWDSYCIQAMFSAVLVPALTATATLAGIAVMLFSRAGGLAWAALGVVLPLMYLIRRLDRPMTEQALRVHEDESGVSARVQETLTGIRAVQAFGREEFESERFRARAGASLSANLRLTVLQSVSQAVVGLVLAAGTGAVIWICAHDVLRGRLTAGDLVLVVAYAAMLFKPIETLAYTAASAQNAAAGARRVLAVLDAAPDVADTPHARPLGGRARGRIAFEGVSFAYRTGRPVLRNIQLDIAPGSAVALVGLSGAGKTTLASLVPRFYDPTVGRVTLDGHDVRSLTLKSLRENIALVTQEPVLFATSVRDNIAYGRPGATAAEIEAAARAAGAHEFVERLPEGYDTQLAERGVTLSGGQRQRISIARAFLKNAPVVILDEPTSALDAETEHQLMLAFRRLMHDRTAIVIAHRLSTIRAATRIVVLHEGEMIEDGTHDELLARSGAYARLYRMQMGTIRAEPIFQ